MLHKIKFFLIPIIFCLKIAFAFSISGSDLHYVAVIDAGSTGSRLHIFSYSLDKYQNPIKINNIWTKKIHPGFAAINPSTEKINKYLTRLFKNAPNIEKIPVYFYATAGMRLLSTSTQEIYYKNLKEWFKKSSKNLVDARTITGREEGVFGWLAINYHLGTLNNLTKKIAMVDIGGASVQIVFPVTNSKNIDPINLVHINLYGNKLKLFVHSFLGLGQEMFSYQFLEKGNCFAKNYPLPNGYLAHGDANLCQQNVSSLINHVHHVKEIVNPALEMNKPDEWYALGGLSTTATESPFEFHGYQFTIKELLQKADQKLCKKDWRAIQNRKVSNFNKSCLRASYYYALLVNGYGINNSKAINYLPNPKDIDWTLGVVLNH